MEKLSRSQRNAALYEQLAKDNEQNIGTQDLSSYQTRLENIQETLNPNRNESAFANQPEYIWKQTNNDYSQNTFNNPINQNVNTQEPVQPQFVNPYTYQPVTNINPVYTNTNTYNPAQTQPTQNIQEPVQPQFVNPTVNPYTYQPTIEPTIQPTVEPVVNPAVEPTVQPVVEPTVSTSSIDDLFNDAFNEIYNDVFNDVKDDVNNNLSDIERDNYLSQAINDANTHNVENGNTTLDQIVDNAVEQVRHNDDLDIQNDEVFASTISTEMQKMVDELSNTITTQIPDTSFDNIIDEQKEIVESVLAEDKTEDVVEIKPIEETLSVKKEEISETIPFVVANDDDEEIEEYEEEGSNTVLNIILIILIIILVIVLGLIVFYILKTKGII